MKTLLFTRDQVSDSESRMDELKKKKKIVKYLYVKPHNDASPKQH